MYAERTECSKYIYTVSDLLKSYVSASRIQTLSSLFEQQISFVPKPDESQYVPPSNSGIQLHRKSSRRKPGSSGMNHPQTVTVIDGSGSSENVPPANSDEYNQDFKDALEDLKILRRLPKYIDNFEKHMMKLCHEEDAEQLKSEIKPLHFMATVWSQKSFKLSPGK